MGFRRRLFVGLYAASGAAALVYEVTWTRLLTLELGHTVAAASTVLAAFMGGLACGAWLVSRRAAATRVRTSPLRAYASLEILIAIVALLLPLALRASIPLLRWAYADGTAPVPFALIRVGLSLALLGVPACAMGATYPIAVGWYARNASQAGALYAANTFGAALGAIGAGFWLIPALGLRGTTGIGVVLNVAAAAGALWLAAATTTETPPAGRAEKASPLKKQKRTPQPERAHRLPPPSHPQPELACAAAAVSGFVALVYEVAWTRLIALVVGPTTYAFATMAAAFIGGLAIGSTVGARATRRLGRPIAWLAAMLIACAVCATVAAWFAASRLPLIVAGEVAAPDAAFGEIVAAQAMRVALLLLPMTCALGAAFPLALAVASGAAASSRPADDAEPVERAAARVYTWNTLGAIGGALAAGFILIPRFGLRGTFDCAAVIGAAAGAVCIGAAWRTGERTRVTRAIVAAAAGAAAIVGIVLVPAWDRDLLASGAYKYAPYMQSSVFDDVLRAGRLEFYKEGAAATVSVRLLAGIRSLAIDGKVDASNGGDMLTQRLLGLLPVLLHRAPHDICVIGLGSGVTVGSALAPGTVRRADVVEISPEVVDASRFFDRENGSVLGRPEVRLIIGDGRTHLRLTTRAYDVIVSEPSNPWMAGVAALFTREFFESARARLKPDGILCQWAHTYDISAADLQSIVRTFASVFPQGTMWMVGDGDLLLVASASDGAPLRLDGIATGRRRGTVPAALDAVGVSGDATPFALLSLYAGGPIELQQYAAGAPIQTDDRMALEFSAPRGIYGRMTNENGDAIRAFARSAASRSPDVQAAYNSATDASWLARGRMERNADAYDLAYEAFHEAVALNSHNVEALAGLTEAAAATQKAGDELTWLRTIAAADPANAPVRIELSHLLAAGGDLQGGAAMATEALQLARDPAAGTRAGEQLASVLADAGDGERLAPLADALVARAPTRTQGRYYRATALFLLGRQQEAADEARRILATDPNDARTLNLLGAACGSTGQWDCARQAFEASIRANPRDSAAYVNLGTFLLQRSDPAAAAATFAEALSIDPTSTAARTGLAHAHGAEKP